MSGLRDGSITVPLTLIAVTGDPLFTREYQEEVFDMVSAPEKNLLLIREDVHLVFNERVEQVVPIILESQGLLVLCLRQN